MRCRRVVALRATLTLACGALPLSAQGVDDGRPVYLPSPSVEILMIDRVSAGRLADERLIRRLLDDCARLMPISVANRGEASRLPPVSTWATSPPESWALEFLIFPRSGGRSHCEGDRTAVHAGVARGLQVVQGSPGETWRPVVSARLVVNGRSVDAAVATPIRLRRLSAAGLESVEDAAMRLTVPIDSLAPSVQGLMPVVSVHVRVAGDVTWHEVEVPAAALDAAWRRALPARLSYRAPRLPTDEQSIVPPPARDRYLQRARDAFMEGDYSDAARLALVRLDDDTLSVEDTRLARVIAGLSFIEQGDDLAARLVLAPAVRDEPCLALAPGRAEAAAAMLAELARPAARCRPARPLRVALQGAVLPGFGRPTSGMRRLAGVVEAAIVVSFLARSQQRLRVAEQRYDDYLAVSRLQPALEFPAYRAQRLYKDTESARRAALISFQSAIVAWGLFTAEAVVSELGWGTYYETVSRYGGAP